MRFKAIAREWKNQVKKHLIMSFFPMVLYIKTGIKYPYNVGSCTVKKTGGESIQGCFGAVHEGI